MMIVLLDVVIIILLFLFFWRFDLLHDLKRFVISLGSGRAHGLWELLNHNYLQATPAHLSFDANFCGL